mgnify:CR=1 FL=1
MAFRELRYPKILKDDVIAIGSFHAIQKDILIVNTVGNNNFDAGATTGNAPWIFTVVASSTNHKIITEVVIDDGTSLVVCVTYQLIFV